MLFGYSGLKYGLVSSKFDYEHYNRWLSKYRRTHRDAENEDAEKQLKENQGAPIDPPLKNTYLKRVVWGKRSIVIFGTVGSLLTLICSIV